MLTPVHFSYFRLDSLATQLWEDLARYVEETTGSWRRVSLEKVDTQIYIAVEQQIRDELYKTARD